MDLIKTNVPGISRDPYSKALHIVDKKGRAEFQEKQKIQSQINNYPCAFEIYCSITSTGNP